MFSILEHFSLLLLPVNASKLTTFIRSVQQTKQLMDEEKLNEGQDDVRRRMKLNEVNKRKKYHFLLNVNSNNKYKYFKNES